MRSFYANDEIYEDIKSDENIVIDKPNRKQPPLSEFRYPIGSLIKENILVLDAYRKRLSRSLIKIYKYRCLVCGNEDEVREYTLKDTPVYICSVCSRQKVLRGYNDIATTHPEYIKYFVNIEDTYNYSYGSRQKVLTKCPDCGNIRYYKIADITYYKTYSCPKCGDGISYPEKIMFNLLTQLNIDFEIQKKFTWSENKFYDFYIPSINVIIETHGSQHYFKKNSLYNIENDNFKENIANKNNISRYIIIDCRKSEVEFIKNNIINSELSILFNLEVVNWKDCHRYASFSSKLIDSCKLFNEELDVKTISNTLKLSTESVRRYLHRGTSINLCNYNGKEMKDKNWEKNRNNNSQSKKIFLIKNGEEIGLFDNTRLLVDYVKNTYDIKLFGTNVSKVCRGILKQHKGFTYKYKI